MSLESNNFEWPVWNRNTNSKENIPWNTSLIYSESLYPVWIHIYIILRNQELVENYFVQFRDGNYIPFP